MNELFREIEEDIRREKFDQLWQNLGKIMVGISIAVVLATIVVVIVQNHRQSQAMEQTSQFIKGVDRLNTQDYKGAIDAFTQLAADAASPYYGLAMLRKAEAQNASGDRDGAAATYKALAAHSGTFGALAEMQTDSGNIVTPNKKSAFYYTLSEWKGWQLMHAGKKEEALAQFSALRDDANAPFSLRQRMQDVVSAMSGDSVKKDEQSK